jgi:cyclohexa-1,5-dienecarbonyl-CoA hydratase
MALNLSFNREGTRAALTYAHPKGIILTAAIVSELRVALEDLTRARHLRLVTIDGAGGDFSFGASVPEHAPGVIDRVLPDMHALVIDLLECATPTAAIVRGRCLGGGFELALACDFIFASDDATFGLPEIALGVFPPAASVLLPRRAGWSRATSAALTGEARPAADWRAAGLLEIVAPREGLAPAIDAWFDRTLARYSAEALGHATRAVRAQLLDAVRRELPAIERLYLHDLMTSHDAAEGIKAFMEKRAPSWRDE